MIDAAFAELAEHTSTKRACALLGKSRATHYRRQRPARAGAGAPRPAPPNTLSPAERAARPGDAEPRLRGQVAGAGVGDAAG